MAAQHDVGRAVQPVDQRVAAAVDVVELALGDRVVDVDGGEEERALLRHLVEAVHAGRGPSLTPRTRRATRFHCPGASFCRRRRSARTTPHSSGSLAGLKAGTLPAFSNSTPLCTRSVASPPSSTMRSGPAPSGHTSASLVHHQYSSSVSPFQAKTAAPRGLAGVPPRPTATAAAAGSCVLKMLHEAQRISAPRSMSVSISTAVCTVMWSEPVMRAPRSGFTDAYFARS